MKTTILCAAVAMLAAGCKPTVEGQMNKWNSNQEAVTRYGLKYPGFKSVLDYQQAEAKKVFDGAQSLGNDEKAKKISDANDKLRELIDPIESYQNDRSALERLMTDRDILKRPAIQVNPAVSLAQLALDRAESQIADAKPPGVSDAKEELAKARQALSDGGTNLRNLKRAIEDEQRRERDARKAAAKPSGKKS